MYRNSEKKETATRKLYELKQTALAIMYIIEFQALLV